MPQHDYVIANQTAAQLRADLNLALLAIAGNNDGATEPSTTYPYMWWYDSTLDILKMRNAADDAWISIITLDQVADTSEPNFTPVSQGDAETGTNNTGIMTPLRTAQHIAADTNLYKSGDTIAAADGGTIGQQTIWIPAGAMTARTTNGAESGSVETTTNKVMLQSLDFDTSTDEFAQFAIQMPKGWDEGTLVAQCVWSHPSTATNFGVVFFLQAVAFANGDAGDTAFGTAQSMTDTGGTTDDIYISPESSAITVAGSPAAEEYVIFQIYRDVSDASDDLAVDARLHGVKIHYTIDTGNDS